MDSVGFIIPTASFARIVSTGAISFGWWSKAGDYETNFGGMGANGWHLCDGATNLTSPTNGGESGKMSTSEA
jgi:hypothetical protein